MFFIIYINDLHRIFKECLVHHNAGNTNLINVNQKISSIETVVNYELKSLVTWLDVNKLSLNGSKTELVIFHPLKKAEITIINIKLRKFKLIPKNFVPYLGVIIDNTLYWNFHLESPRVKLARANGTISKLRHFVPEKTCVNIYYSLMYSHLLNGYLVWNQLPKQSHEILFRLEKKCVRIISFADFNAPSTPLFDTLKILKLNDIFLSQTLIFINDFLNRKIARCFINFFCY